MKIEILSFAGNLFKSETVESVTAMTKVWEITILEGHTPLVTVMNPSIVNIVYIDDAGEKKGEILPYEEEFWKYLILM
jgi:F0F1-type ATP synthase epsilon subunit